MSSWAQKHAPVVFRAQGPGGEEFLVASERDVRPYDCILHPSLF